MKQALYRIYLVISIGAIFISSLPMSAAPLGGAGTARSYDAARYELRIAGESCGYIKGVSGGAICGDVTESKVASSPFRDKHLAGGLKYENVSLKFLVPPDRPMGKWIQDFLNGNSSIKDVSVISSDYNYNPKSELKLKSARIVEVTIPACDGASTDQGYMQVTLAAESISDVKLTATSAGSKPGISISTATKQWQPSRFVLEIDGLNCKKVNKIEAITIEKDNVEDKVGDLGLTAKEPGKLTFPNLRISIAASDADSWRNWFDDFVVKDNNNPASEKSGRILLLAPQLDKTKPLATIVLHNLGMCRMERASVESNADGVMRNVFELYCERIEFLMDSLPTQTSSAGTSEPEKSTELEKTQSDASDASGAKEPTDDCQVGETYRLGKDNPLNLSVNKLEYTMGRVNIGGSYHRPNPNEKLMVVHYTLENPTSSDLPLDAASLDWTATDSNGVSREPDNLAAIEETGGIFSQKLGPGKKVNCYIFLRMPGKGASSKLSVGVHGENVSVASYDIRDRVAAITSPYADPDDNTGSTPTMIIPGKFGVAYNIGDYDITADSLAYNTQVIADWELAKDRTYAIVSVGLKSFADQAFGIPVWNLVLKDADGQTYDRKGILPASSLRLIDLKPDPGESIKFRLAYDVPKEVVLKSLTMKDDIGRSVIIKLSGETPTAPKRVGPLQ